MFLPHLGADEHVRALETGLAQALAVLHLVTVEGGGVEMAVAELQCGLHRLYTDIPLQGHGPKTDHGNAGAMGFNDLHHNLLGLRLECGSGWEA